MANSVGGADTVRATLQYIRPPVEPPFCVMYPRRDGGPQENCVYDPRPVDIADARRFTIRPTIDNAGFELHDAPARAIDFSDEAAIRRSYHPEVEELAMLATGGSSAVAFDHLVRRREPDRRALTFGRHGGGVVGPVGRVHNDYTEASGRKRLGLVMGERARDVGGRYCIVNVWRPLGHPVVDTPLALCDARSVLREDLVATQLRYEERVGEAYLLLHRPSHRWAFFDRVRPDEAIVFKQYDSATHVARFTPHAAFELPDLPPGTPLRTSIEARVLVLF